MADYSSTTMKSNVPEKGRASHCAKMGLSVVDNVNTYLTDDLFLQDDKKHMFVLAALCFISLTST